MQAIKNWRAVLHKAWSVRLFVLSVLLQVADVLLSTYGSFSTSLRWSIWLQVAGVACSVAGVIARFVFQGSIHGSGES